MNEIYCIYLGNRIIGYATDENVAENFCCTHSGAWFKETAHWITVKPLEDYDGDDAD